MLTPSAMISTESLYVLNHAKFLEMSSADTQKDSANAPGYKYLSSPLLPAAHAIKIPAFFGGNNCLMK